MSDQPEQTDSSDNSFERIGEMLDFPADFPVKVMGINQEGFVEAIAQVVTDRLPGFDVTSIAEKPSRNGKFLSLTVPLRVESAEQLQSIYESLGDHPMVRIVL